MNIISVRECIPDIFSDINIASSLWGCDIDFLRGERYLIKAASGRGKSTLCSYIIGHREDYSGEILFDGTTTKSLDREMWGEVRRSQISYLPQGLMLFNELTSYENIAIKNSLTNHKSSEWIKEALTRVGLSDRIDSAVEKLSFGEKQRVALIRSLCQPFSFIIMDEPISHIDDSNSEKVVGLLTEELEAKNATLIATSIGKEMDMEYTTIINAN